MKVYAALWGIGLVLVVIGFALSLEEGFSVLPTVLIAGGFGLGILGFFAFTKRDQGTPA